MMKGLGAGAEAGPRQELRLGLHLQVLSTRERPLLSSEFNFSPLAGGVGMALIKEMCQMSEVSFPGRGEGTGPTKQAHTGSVSGPVPATEPLEIVTLSCIALTSNPHKHLRDKQIL